MIEIRVEKEGSDHPKVFSFHDLDIEDSLALTCAKLDEMHKTNGFMFEVLGETPIVAEHIFGENGYRCVQCTREMDMVEQNYGSKELPCCCLCFNEGEND